LRAVLSEHVELRHRTVCTLSHAPRHRTHPPLIASGQLPPQLLKDERVGEHGETQGGFLLLLICLLLRCCVCLAERLHGARMKLSTWMGPRFARASVSPMRSTAVAEICGSWWTGDGGGGVGEWRGVCVRWRLF
jgi:hypothetical protein